MNPTWRCFTCGLKGERYDDMAEAEAALLFHTQTHGPDDFFPCPECWPDDPAARVRYRCIRHEAALVPLSDHPEGGAPVAGQDY